MLSPSPSAIMTWILSTYINVFLVSVAPFATPVTASPDADKPSIANAENRVQELAIELANIRKTIRPRHCTDLLRGGQRTSGLYNIFPNPKNPIGTVVYCDMEMDGGGWTVIQRRGQYGNSVYYFYRNWTEYAKGFGDPAKEYWIGNRVLHALTTLPERMQLRVILNGNDTVVIDYDSMKVENEALLFRMRMGRFLRPLGWDALSDTNDLCFTTYDRDHDLAPENCADRYRGAWWYRGCHLANLNGLNLNGPHASYADGIEWAIQGKPERDYYYSYPSVQMMIRPAMAYAEKLIKKKGGVLGALAGPERG
ncbi:techylectin-5A-like [Amblyomma americanum]